MRIVKSLMISTEHAQGILMRKFKINFLNSFSPFCYLPQSRAEQSKVVNLEWYYYWKITTTSVSLQEQNRVI